MLGEHFLLSEIVEASQKFLRIFILPSDSKEKFFCPEICDVCEGNKKILSGFNWERSTKNISK